MEKKDVTIYDIAENLGLSPSTISKGLQRHSTISVKTQKRIALAAESMGYCFNTFAANLRKRKTNTIGLIVPRLNSFFMSQVIAGIESVTNDKGYNLIISQSLETVDKEIRNAKTMFSNRVDGLLVSLAENTDSLSHFNIFLQKKVPLLFFDRIPSNQEFPSISINNEQAGYQITKHLLEQGARNIVHITGNLRRNIYAERLAGYKKALREHNIEDSPEKIVFCDLSELAGIAAAQSVMALKADAVFVANDVCAVGCMNEVKRLGIGVPGEMLFAGFNNDMISRNVSPPLTTFDYPGYEMGKIAANTLLGHLEDRINIDLTENFIVKSKLIPRASSVFQTLTMPERT